MNNRPRPSSAVLIARIPVGLLVGFVVAVPELLIVLAYGVAMLYLRVRGRQPHGLFLPGVLVVTAAGLEYRRVAWYAGIPEITFTTKRTWLYLLVRPWIGLLGGAIGVLLVYGAVIAVHAIVGWSLGREVDGIPPSPRNLAYLLVVGIVLAFITFAGLGAVIAIERLLVVRLLGPTRADTLAEQVFTLRESRAEVVREVDAERRRIERDLHDGVQQRMVALGMLIGRARRGDDPRRRAELLEQAHTESQRLLSDLREVSWRIYPAALKSEGLRVAIESVIERCAIPVTLTYEVPKRLSDTVETAAYFVVCESVTNAAKHSQASHVDVDVVVRSKHVMVSVRDDGVGGADHRGGGLYGLSRRVSAVDGTFDVTSPGGGPTVVMAELPCA